MTGADCVEKDNLWGLTPCLRPPQPLIVLNTENIQQLDPEISTTTNIAKLCCWSAADSTQPMIERESF